MPDTADAFRGRFPEAAAVSAGGSSAHVGAPRLADACARKILDLSGGRELADERAVFLVPHRTALSAVEAWIEILARDQSPRYAPARFERIFHVGPSGRESPYLRVDLPAGHAGGFERFLALLRFGEGVERLSPAGR